jgi:hypothetical protein
MRHRHLLVGVASGVFTAVVIGAAPAAATPCTDLQSLQLEHTVITSAQDNTTGVFVVPNSNPPQALTGLPAFCRVTATLIPTSDSAIRIEVWLPETTWNGRFLGTGGGVPRNDHLQRARQRHPIRLRRCQQRPRDRLVRV